MKYSYKSAQSMNLRPSANVNNAPVGSIPANVTAYGDEVTTYSNGDKWLKVLEGGSALGWVAVIHLGKIYGVLTELAVEPPPPPVQEFPDYFDLTDPQGNTRRYVLA